MAGLSTLFSLLEKHHMPLTGVTVAWLRRKRQRCKFKGSIEMGYIFFSHEYGKVFKFRLGSVQLQDTCYHDISFRQTLILPQFSANFRQNDR